MSKEKSRWGHTRAIEQTLEQKIQKALRDSGLQEDFIDELSRSRKDQPETILPETDQEIEWRIRESRRIARHFGLHVPMLTD